MDILENLKQNFKRGDANIRLIYINAAVFLCVNLMFLGFKLFIGDGSFILTYLAVPARLSTLLTHAWTVVTYMFLHESFFHFFFNVLTLFWFGKLFLMFFSEKQLTGLYITGGLFGALLYIVAYNVFPLFQAVLNQSLLMGASASIMAIVIATAMRSPNMEMQMLLIGRIKLKYIAAFFVLTSIFGIAGENAGGQFAHLGRALAGYIFIVSLRKGRDITSPVNAVLNGFANWFKPRKLKVKPNPHKTKRTVMSDGDFNAEKARKSAEIDRILDKIKSSGYESLSAEEKRRLFDQNNKN